MPVRAAMKRVSVTKEVAQPDADAFYILTVEGLKFGMGRNRQQEETQAATGPRPIDPRMQERLQAGTQLTVKGKDATKPAKIDSIAGGDGTMTIRFYFPRSMEINLDDKEVTFQTQVGPMEVKQKFVLKEMTFDGKLAL
jgi:hypothetical protein